MAPRCFPFSLLSCRTHGLYLVGLEPTMHRLEVGRLYHSTTGTPPPPPLSPRFSFPPAPSPPPIADARPPFSTPFFDPPLCIQAPEVLSFHRVSFDPPGLLFPVPPPFVPTPPIESEAPLPLSSVLPSIASGCLPFLRPLLALYARHPRV